MVLDFSKAFHSVPHKRLLKKLTKYGIEEKTIVWIAEWLKRRSQTVVLDGEKSDPESDISWCTARYNPLLVLFINDIGDKIQPKIKLFAADCLLYRPIVNSEDCEIL